MSNVPCVSISSGKHQHITSLFYIFLLGDSNLIAFNVVASKVYGLQPYITASLISTINSNINFQQISDNRTCYPFAVAYKSYIINVFRLNIKCHLSTIAVNLSCGRGNRQYRVRIDELLLNNANSIAHNIKAAIVPAYKPNVAVPFNVVARFYINHKTVSIHITA